MIDARDMEKPAGIAGRRKSAIISALALAAMALGIYVVVIMQFFVYK